LPPILKSKPNVAITSYTSETFSYNLLKFRKGLKRQVTTKNFAFIIEPEVRTVQYPLSCLSLEMPKFSG